MKPSNKKHPTIDEPSKPLEETEMICPKCQTKNPQGAKFCMNCASSLEHPAGLAHEARLQALLHTAPRGLHEKVMAARKQVIGERKPVTILFTDIVGSTSIAETMDPEDWSEIVAGMHQLVSNAVYRYEGTITQLLGDGVLAFFGAPITHEDDPNRAVHAALEIQESVVAYREGLSPSINIHMRVGINTGEVVVRDIGTDLHVEYLAFGDAVNLASRLEGAAKPGTILVSEGTHRLIAPAFETESLSRIQVKGKSEPVSAYRVIAAKSEPGKLRGVEGLASELVGRDEEFMTLLRMLDRLEVGEGGIATIVGEAGIGKSRLVAELRRKVDDAEIQWIEGRCLSYGGSIPYLLWLDALQTVFGIREEADPIKVQTQMRERLTMICGDRAEDVYPYLGRLLSLPLDEEVTASLEELEGGELKSRTFRAVKTFLGCAAEDRPMVFICEDLHWADPSSLELLEAVLPLTDRAPLLVVCVQRPEKEHGSWQLREAISTEYADRHINLELAPLTERESVALVDNLVGLDGVPSELKERILRRAEGNPFYMEEILRSLKDIGVLVQEEATGKWMVIGEVEAIEIPDTLQGVLLARIDRLQEDTKRVLQMASVIGRIFLYRVLTAISEEERELDEHLEILEGEEMVRERARLPELEYIFKHHLTQEAAYNALLKKERRRYHKEVAKSLEELFPERIEDVGVLAHHWEESGDPEKAVEYLQRAGDQNRMMYAHTEAIDYYERAIGFLKETKDFESAARTYMKMGLTFHTAFDFSSSQAAYDEAFHLWNLAAEATATETLPPAPHALRVNKLVITLDPCLAEDASTNSVVKELYSGLVRIGPQLSVVPEVASSWKILECGRKYVFNLRDDFRWSDGAPVTAEDFEFAWKRVLTNKDNPQLEPFNDIRGAEAFFDGQCRSLDGVKVLDPKTISVELEEPTGYFLHLLASIAQFFPVPKHIVENYGDAWIHQNQIVTNGPFIVAERQPDQILLLQRNDQYPGIVRGNVERVHIHRIRMSHTLEQYKDNLLDIIDFAYADSKRVLSDFPNEYRRYPAPGVSLMAFNIEEPPFNDVRVRKAIAHAVDRKQLVNAASGGYNLPATGGIIPPGIPGHSPNIGLQYDPQRARELLEEAGYPEGVGFPEVDVRIHDSPTFVKSVEYMQVQLREVLNLRISPTFTTSWEEWFQIDEILPGQIVLFIWGVDVPDPHDFVPPGGILSLTKWEDVKFDHLIRLARTCIDQQERLSLYHEAEKILIEDAPLIPTAYLQGRLLMKPWIRVATGTVQYQWSFRDIIIDPH